MAAKQKVAKETPSTAVVIPKSTAVVDIMAELAKEAAAQKTRLGSPGGDQIRTTQDKNFVFPNGTKSAGPIRVVILDFVSANMFFDRPYKKGEEAPPACFALGENAKGLIPSANSPDKQEEACDICPNNEFGSKGAGKACSNLRLLAVVEDSDNEEAPIRVIKVSSTAIKAFDAYAATIQAQFDTPPVGVTTEIYFDAGVDFASLRFGNPMPNPNLGVHFPRRAAAKDRLLSEPDVSQYTPPQPAKGNKKR